MSIQTYDNLIDLMKESIYFETKKYNSSFYRKILRNLHTNSYDKSIDFS